MTYETKVLSFEDHGCEVTARANGDRSGWACRVHIVFPDDMGESELAYSLNSASAEEAHNAARKWALGQIHSRLGIRGRRIFLG